jgi:hypothetical protein
MKQQMELHVNLTYVVALVIASVGFCRMAFPELERKKRLIPMVALALSLAFAFLMVEGSAKEIVLNASVAALTAMGLWSGGKAVAGK